MRFKLLAAMLLLSACQTGSVDASAEFSAYVQCNQGYATRFAKQSGDPYSLAVAAAASCRHEKVGLLYKLREARGPGGALNLMDGLEQDAVKSNMGVIVRARSF